ncbi:hypothetical protein [Actinacidiphila paucisporea]|uniref:Serine/arginine repetitive matrix protein 2 n=1 Tax=Actinacidiphila paucisporea TaxID=310782 RepID=A0A1M6WCM2_9ACTN|nr:hypothetical protein [Actinacidiphila paucisporea]SHK91399.1 hypothetical protein SAMN05216499_10261 [Actinacidiphila paucisporea]
MARWDAENQRWAQDPPPGAAGGPGPASVPRTPGGNSRVLIVALAVVLVCAAAGIGLWAAQTDSGGGGGSSPAAGAPGFGDGTSAYSPDPATAGDSDTTDLPTTEDPTTDFPTTEDPSTEPATTGPPPGFAHLQDVAGFTLDVPESWQRSSGGASVYYQSQDQQGLIQVFSLSSPQTTPYESLKATEATVSTNNGYQLLGLRYIIDDQASDAADLEYTYVRDDGGTRHVVDRAFTGPDGVQYALLVAGPDSDWSSYQDVFRVLRASFCPDNYCTQ